MGPDSFVNDAAGFEDGAGRQGEPMEFHQDEGDVVTFLRDLEQPCCSM